MIFTIGATKHYLKWHHKCQEDGVPFEKAGRSSDCEGGSVWQTREEAENYLIENNKSNFSVFGVDADWDLDTEPNENDSWNNLLVDSEIIILD
jgi:hypothetical protein